VSFWGRRALGLQEPVDDAAMEICPAVARRGARESESVVRALHPVVGRVLPARKEMRVEL